jgi:hypothetical protein
MPCALNNLTKTVAKNHAAPQILFGSYFSFGVDCPVRIRNFQSAELANRSRKLPPFPAFLVAHPDNVNNKGDSGWDVSPLLPR